MENDVSVGTMIIFISLIYIAYCLFMLKIFILIKEQDKLKNDLAAMKIIAYETGNMLMEAQRKERDAYIKLHQTVWQSNESLAAATQISNAYERLHNAVSDAIAAPDRASREAAIERLIDLIG